MQLDSFLNFLQESRLAVLIDGSRAAAMVIQIFHILGFTFLLALVLAFNIRALRLSLTALPLQEFARTVYKPYWAAVAVAIAAGVLLFLPRAVAYSNNSAFGVKMLVLVLAAVVQGVALRLALRHDGGTVASHGIEISVPAFAGTSLKAAGMTSGGAGTQILAPASESSFAFRALALGSLLLWLATGVAGRAIGFVV